MQILDFERFCKACIISDPFEYLVLPGFVRSEYLASIRADFPSIDRGGSFPLKSLCFGRAFAN
jgi:hypothetical protein